MLAYYVKDKSHLQRKGSKHGPIIIQHPSSMVAEKKAHMIKDIDRLWPDILAHIVDYPEKGLNSLYLFFGRRCGLGVAEFKSACQTRGFAMIRKKARDAKSGTVKTGRKESLQLTEDFAASFQKRRKHEGVNHLNRMSNMVKSSMDVLEKENELILKEDNTLKQVVMVDGHIDRLTKLHKLATPVYGLDSESKEDKASANVAFLMNFTPIPLKDQAIEI